MLASEQGISVDGIHYGFRAALTEARLMTPKQASDQGHFRVLAEELRSIEQSIASQERDQHILDQQSDPQRDTGPGD